MTICIIPANHADMRLVEGEPMLLRAIKRARTCNALTGVVVTTTAHREEDGVVRKCKEWKVPYYRGGDDVLDRVYAAAVVYRAHTVACFFPEQDVKPENIEWAVTRLHETKGDYARSGKAEAFDFDGLVRAWVEASGRERDSPSTYILEHHDEFLVDEGTEI